MQTIFKEKKDNFSVYFVGIGGISMSSLALYLKKTGFKVSGYDQKESDITKSLERQGIVINNMRELLNCDIAVVSSAISEEDEQIKLLKNMKKPFITRARLLYEISTAFPFFVGVAGTHGKTTVTAMLAHVLKGAKEPFCAHIGGLDSEFGNLAYMGERLFLSEICEYKKNINLFSPTVGVLLNVSDDHVESYGCFSNLERAFSDFLTRSQYKIVWHEQRKYADKSAVTFSITDENADYFGKVKQKENGIELRVYEHRAPLFEININSLHVHDALNAVAVVAAAKVIGVNDNYIVEGLESFKGIKRRNEIMQIKNGTVIYADYAHHPDQIVDCVCFLKKRYKRVAVLFQSHTFSRTEQLFSKFQNALSKIDDLFIFDTYAAREKYNYQGSGKRLSESLKGCVYLKGAENVKNVLPALIGRFDCVAVVGAGDLYDHVESYLNKNK